MSIFYLINSLTTEMLQRFQQQLIDDPRTHTADSFSHMFQPLSTSSASTFYSKLSQQFIVHRHKLARPSLPNKNQDNKQQLNDSQAFEQQLQKELICHEVADWQKFMQMEMEAVQELNDQAEKQQARKDSKKYDGGSTGSPLKKGVSYADVNLNQKATTEREKYFVRMKLGNKNLGRLSQKDFNQLIRQEGTLREYAKVYKQDPPNLYLSLNINQMHQVPKGYGLISNSTQVNSSRYLRSRQDVRAYSSALSTRQAKNIQSVQLNHNLFDNYQLRDLLMSFPQSLKEVELVDCKLTFQHVDVLMQYASKQMIQKINLEQNYIRDQGCKTIMKYLMNNSTLQHINLNNNKITDSSAISISNLLKQTQRLIELYIGFNHFTANGGLQIWKSMYKNTSIKILDMSHNAIASLECAQAIAKAVSRPYNELLHLDLSYNKFNAEQSQAIADALVKNETIFGFHFEGNFPKIIVNPNGFLLNLVQEQVNREKKLQLLYKEEQVFKLLDEEKQEATSRKTDYLEDFSQYHRLRKIRSTRMNVSMVNKVNQLDTCWICEGWQETRFEWNPQRSGQMYNEPIFIHIDFEGFKPLLLTHLNNEFFLVKMCPPNTEVRYFFTNPILGIQQVAQDQTQLQLKEPIPQQPFLYNDEILVDGNSMSVVNVLTTGNKVPLFDKYMNLIQCKPREQPAKFDFSPYLKTKKFQWSVENSIFRYFQPDTPELISQCFEFDFQNSKVTRLVKEGEVAESKEILKQIYLGLFKVYKFYASGNNAHLPCLTVADYIDFLIQANLMEGMKTNDIDISFTSTAGAKDVSFPQAYEKGLVRCQLLEIMIRLCNDKYIRAGVHATMPDALNALNQQLQDLFNRFDQAQEWRKLRYWLQKVDIMIHDRLAMFKLLYKYTCKLSKKPQQYKYDYVSAQDFKDIFTQSKIICDELTEKECYLVFLQSMQTQKDELFSPKHFQMNFYEFLEGCCRIAEKLSIIRGDKPMDLEDRRVKDLHNKIDGFLLLIYLLIGNEMKQALPNDVDARNVDKCMINDYKTLKQKLEDSFTDEDKPPYNPIVELPHLSAQVVQSEQRDKQNKKQSLRQQVKQQRKDENKFSLTNMVSYFKSLQPQQ